MTAKAKSSFLESSLFLRDLSREPILITHAKSVYLYDDTGKAYLDAACGAAVTCLGHGNEEIAAVLSEQLKSVAYAHPSKFVTEAALELGEKLVARAPEGLSKVIFTSGGSESVEAALKLARQYQLSQGHAGKYKVISRQTSYHGATLGALAASGQPGRRELFAPMLAKESKIAPAYPYRCAFCADKGSCTLSCADDLERVILAEDADTVAAFIAEPIVGSSIPGSHGSSAYWQRIRDLCDNYDVLFIADEVMSGNGRSGKWWAMQHTNVTPDMIVTAKGIGAGYTSLGAVLIHEKIYKSLRDKNENFRHGQTYSGNPLSCAVGSKVIDIIERDHLLHTVADKGNTLLAALHTQFSDHPHVGDIRGRGLLLGIEFVKDKTSKTPFEKSEAIQTRLSQACLQRGLYLYQGGGSADGVRGDHLLMAPPFILEDSHSDELITKLSGAMDEVFT